MFPWVRALVRHLPRLAGSLLQVVVIHLLSPRALTPKKVLLESAAVLKAFRRGPMMRTVSRSGMPLSFWTLCPASCPNICIMRANGLICPWGLLWFLSLPRV